MSVQSRWWARFGVVVAVLAVFAGLAWLAKPAWAPGFRGWRLKQELKAAQRALDSGRPEEALVRIRRAGRYGQTNAGLWLLYARAMREKGGPGLAAVEVLALNYNPENLDQAVAALNACADERQHALAERVIPDILKHHSTNGAVWMAIGKLLAQRGYNPLAYASVRRGAELLGDRDQARYVLSVLELESQDAAMRESARSNLVALAAREQWSRPARLALARAEPDAARALEWLAPVVAASPDDLELAAADFTLRHRVDASGSAARLDALWKRFDSMQGRVRAMSLGVQSGQFAWVRERLKTLPRRDLESSELRPVRLALEAGEKRWNDVLRITGTGLATTSRPEEIADLLGWQIRASVALGAPEGVNSAAERLREVIKNSPSALLRTAFLLESEGAAAEARPFYLAAATGGPAARTLALMRLEALAATREAQEELVELTDKLHKSDPGDAELGNILACFLLEFGMDAKRALVLAEQAVASSGDRPEVLETQAFALARNGQTAKALEIYDRLPAELQGVPVVRLHRAEALIAAGRMAEAAPLLRGLPLGVLSPAQRARAQGLLTKLAG
jgi:hypothetical protein